MTSQTFMASLDGHQHTVHVERYGHRSIVQWIASQIQADHCLLITDDRVADLHGRDLKHALDDLGYRADLLSIGRGEGSKTLQTIEQLYAQSLAAGTHRKTLVIALGGGVVGDTAGFFASTLMRGLPLVHVPTTVMAQVDSSLGGKVGVNFGAGKNLVGAFYAPQSIFVNLEYLATLPETERRNGLAEVVKHGAIAEPALLGDISVYGQDLVTGDLDRLYDVVCRALAIKLEIVQADYLDHGRRAVLNFGHTLGHALEMASQAPGRTALRHGEAVALGMVFATELSEVRMGLSSGARMLIRSSLSELALPTDWASQTTDSVLNRLKYDKKAEDSAVNFIMIEDLGRPVRITMPLDELKASARDMAKQTVRVNQP
ncbi:MAG: 3-dehydroquinate synthase [Myxococcota bacterium]|nr:3-dehydroquinate synthase [Myxococcota bacterium]